ncbi:MAG: TolC family protein [Ignavibacteriales bacterium]|nr:TolC family protein [Ignavibacteriales bacterium]
MLKKIIFLLTLQTTILLAQERFNLDSLSNENLSLKKALDFALENNPEINKVREQIFIKDGEWWSSFGIDSPTFSFAKEGIDKNIPDSFLEQRWHIQQSIDFPLTTYFRLNKISREKQALNEQFKNASNELVAKVKLSYVDVLYNKRILGLRKKQIDLAEELKKAATSKLEAGEIAELEMMKSEIQLAEAQNFYEDATQQYHKARYNLFNVIGLDPSLQKYDIVFDDTLRIAVQDLSEFDEKADIDNQPLVLSYKNLLESSSSNINEAWSTFLPKINFNYFKQDFGNGFNFNGYEIGVSVPIWFIFNQNGSIQTAKAQYREIEWSLKEAKLKIKTEIENAWHGYESSKAKINRYEKTIRDLADELQSLTLTGYQLGELDLLRLLDAQQTYLNSEINYYNALKDYYQQIIYLEKYLGKEIIF